MACKLGQVECVCAETYLSIKLRIICWYFRPCLSAWALKKFRLPSDKAKVIFTVFSLKTSWSGGGRKSLTARAALRSTSEGSSVYLMRFFIELFSFPPMAGTKDANSLSSANKSDCNNAVDCFAYAKKALFVDSMCHIPLKLHNLFLIHICIIVNIFIWNNLSWRADLTHLLRMSSQSFFAAGDCVLSVNS